MRFEADAAVEVVGTADRTAVGLNHWIDGTFGVIRTEQWTLAIAPNGQRLSRHRLDKGGFVDGLVEADQAIQGLPPSVDHASGGPLLRDPRTGALVLVYHGEEFADGDNRNFTSFIGLAESTDDGETFHHLGPIIASDRPAVGPDETRIVELGAGGFVIADGWMQVFFIDRDLGGPRIQLATARCRVDDVFAAAAQRRAPAFTTFGVDGWTEPALGGRAVDLLPQPANPVMWCDAARIAPPGGSPVTLIVYSSVLRLDDGSLEWVPMARTSADGLTWSTPTTLGPSLSGELLYLTVDSGGPDQRVIEGDSFDVYRVSSNASYRWDDARLERVTVRITSR